MRNMCFWLQVRRRSSNRNSGEERKTLQPACKFTAAKRKHHVPLLTAGYDWANTPWILLTASEGSKSNPNPILVVSLQRGRPCTVLTVKFYPGSFSGFYISYISLRNDVNKELKCLQLNVHHSKLSYSIKNKGKSANWKFLLVRQSDSNHVVPKMSPSGPISDKCPALFWNVISPRTYQCDFKFQTAVARCIIFQVLSKWDQSCLMFCVWHVNEQTDVAQLLLGLIRVILKIWKHSCEFHHFPEQNPTSK